MNITFVLPTLNLTGGVRVVSIYARLLSQRGHDVTVISPNRKLPTFKERFKGWVNWKGYQFRDVFDSTYFNDIDFELKLLDSYRPVESQDVPDSDIVIATFWNTAEWLYAFPESKGKKVYFIQHYEVHPWLPVERVEQTLRLPFEQIAVSQWIADILQDKYGKTNVAVIGNGVDHQQFYAEPRQKNACMTVGVMYADEKSFKGCDLAIASVIKARELIPDLKLVSFSARKPVSTLPLPENTQFYYRPEQNSIRHIYSKCDAWLFGSRQEGFGLPLLEAMACRTPVIATKAGAAPELLANGGGMLVDIGDVHGMADAIVKVARMTDDEWQELSNEAHAISKDNSWDAQVEHLERELIRIING